MWKYYLGLDFETANHESASACALGLCLSDAAGEILCEENILINPETYFYSSNIAVHGIRPADVKDSPSFPFAHQRLQDLLLEYPGSLVVCHNARFDIGVLQSSCRKYSLPCPVFPYICTLRTARKCCRNLESYRLSALSKTFSLPDFSHHNALADARQALLLLMYMQHHFAHAFSSSHEIFST